MNPVKLTESQLQQQCIKWFRYAYPKYRMRLFAIPNGGLRNKIAAVKMKREGALSGVPDLFLAMPNSFQNKVYYNGLFIEMKVGKNGLTKNQKEFRDDVISDYSYRVCRSFEDFKDIINSWIVK